MTELEPEQKAQHPAPQGVVSVDQQELARFHSANVTDGHTRDWRKAALVVLIHHFCTEHGLSDTAAALREESRVQINDYSVCDNIDLESILTDFETFYHHKFRKKVKLIRHHPAALFNINSGSSSTIPTIKNNLSSRNSSSNKILARVRSKSARPRVSPASQSSAANNEKADNRNFSRRENATQFQAVTSNSAKNNEAVLYLSGVGPISKKTDDNVNIKPEKPTNYINFNTPSIMPPSSRDLIPHMDNNLSNYTEEWRELSRQITRDLVTDGLGVTMDDVVGMDEAKQILREAIIYPRKYPEMFSALGGSSALGRHFEPWRGLLLHGPPGTGKTMLAKAVASEAGLPFFNVSVSTIVSKWRGDSEKAIRVLFDMARMRAPSIIFIDEIDALGGRRHENEHEATRRMKTELLVQLDGLLPNTCAGTSMSQVAMSNDDDMDVVDSGANGNYTNLASNWNQHVFVLAASNMPWDIDSALLRRLEKQVFIDLPNTAERMSMVQKFFGGGLISNHLQKPVSRSSGILGKEFNYESIAEATEGFSGAQIHLACKEAVMKSVREAVAFIEQENKSKNQQRRILTGVQQKKETKLKEVTTEAMQKAVEEIRTSAETLTHKGGRRSHESPLLHSSHRKNGCRDVLNKQEVEHDDEARVEMNLRRIKAPLVERY